jgi:hypothetical protein
MHVYHRLTNTVQLYFRAVFARRHHYTSTWHLTAQMQCISSNYSFDSRVGKKVDYLFKTHQPNKSQTDSSVILPIVNSLVKQYCHHWAPFGEKLRVSSWTGLKSWWYFPEESANPENYLTITLFDVCSEISLLEVCSNKKLVADFWCLNAVFLEEIQILNVVSVVKGSQTLRTGLGLVSLERWWSILVSVVLEFSWQLEPFRRRGHKYISWNAFFQGVDVFPLNFSVKNCPIGVTLDPVWDEEISFLMVWLLFMLSAYSDRLIKQYFNDLSKAYCLV